MFSSRIGPTAVGKPPTQPAPAPEPDQKVRRAVSGFTMRQLGTRRPSGSGTPVETELVSRSVKPVEALAWTPSPRIPGRKAIETLHGAPKEGLVVLGMTVRHSSGYRAVLDAVDRYHADPTRAHLTQLATHLENYIGGAGHSRKQAMTELLGAVRDDLRVMDLVKHLSLMRSVCRSGCPVSNDELIALVRESVPREVLVRGIQAGLDAPTIRTLHAAGLRIPAPSAGRSPVEVFKTHVTDLSPVGKGNVAQAQRFDHKGADGITTPWIFKAENPEADPGVGAKNAGIPASQANLANRSACVWRVSQMLGLDIVPETRLAVVGGKAGSVMGLAPGASPMSLGTVRQALDAGLAQRIRESPEKLDAYARAQGFSSAKLEGDTLVLAHFTQRQMYDDEGKPLLDENGSPRLSAQAGDCFVVPPLNDPQLRQQLTRLEWLDFLTNEQDRGLENYFISIDPGSQAVQLSAIDNDASFGGQAARFGKPAPSEASQGWRGSRASRLAPTYPRVMDRSLYDNFLALEPAQLRSALAGRLSPEEIGATCHRLEQIQRHLRDAPKGALQIVEAPQEWGSEAVEEALGLRQARAGFESATAPVKPQTEAKAKARPNPLNALDSLQSQPEMKHYLVRLALEQERQRWIREQSPPSNSPTQASFALHDPHKLRSLFEPAGDGQRPDTKGEPDGAG